MNAEIKSTISYILKKNNELHSQNWNQELNQQEKAEQLKNVFMTYAKPLSTDDQNRVLAELEGWGPLHQLMQNEEISEILVNQYDQIFVEKYGAIQYYPDHFYNEQTYNECIERICQSCQSFINKDKTYLEHQIKNWRISIIYKDIARGQHLLSIRQQPIYKLNLQDLKNREWCTQIELDIIKKIISTHKNFIVVGGTSSGKTTVLQAIMKEIPETERQIVIEDTQELEVAHPLSTSLLARMDLLQNKNTITMTDLLKRALRLRPDRLVVGEIRGGEAKDLLMSLSTGHEGSFGSMHAKNHLEALLRLEMLTQLGAPQWSLESIRRLIGLTINFILVVKKDGSQRKLQGIYKLTSVESMGISSHRVESIDDIN